MQATSQFGPRRRQLRRFGQGYRFRMRNIGVFEPLVQVFGGWQTVVCLFENMGIARLVLVSLPKRAPGGARLRPAKQMTAQGLNSRSLVRAMLAFVMGHVALVLGVVALVYATP